MKYTKLNPTLVVVLFSAMGAYATSAKANWLDLCTTVPTTTGANINSECPYTPAVSCCYISAGNTTQYVTQTQSGKIVNIRRNTTSMVTIYGLR